MPRSKKNKDNSLKDLPKEWREALAEETSFYRRRKKRKIKERKKSFYFWVMLFSLLAWFLLNRYWALLIPPLTLNFGLILPFFNFLIWVNIIGSFLLLFESGRRFRSSLAIIESFLAIIFFYRLYLSFPFDFAFWPNAPLCDLVMKLILVAAMVGGGATIILHSLELLWGES